jgi:hypothetical protein
MFITISGGKESFLQQPRQIAQLTVEQQNHLGVQAGELSISGLLELLQI